jgi:transposase-like protein
MKLNSSVKSQAFKLRKKGESYSKISQQLGISKSTLSYWFSDVEWSQKVKKRLSSINNVNSISKIAAMNRRRAEIRQENVEKIKIEAEQEFNSLKHDQLFLTALALYWGEGSKTNNGRVSVVNSDPELLKVVIAFYRRILKIPEHKLRVEMFMYKDHDEDQLKRYWSEILSVSQDNFIKTQLLPSRSSLTKRKVSKGVCAVYFSNTAISIKILHWIELLSSKLTEKV